MQVMKRGRRKPTVAELIEDAMSAMNEVNGVAERIIQRWGEDRQWR